MYANNDPLQTMVDITGADLPGITACSCDNNLPAVFYCHRADCERHQQTYYCFRCSQDHDHKSVFIKDECNTKKNDVTKFYNEVINLNDEAMKRYTQFKPLIEYCAKFANETDDDPKYQSIRKLDKDAKAIETLVSQTTNLKNEAEVFASKNQLVEIIELQPYFDDVKKKLGELKFMSELCEDIIWDCYMNVFIEDDKGDIKDFNSENQALYFKLKQKASNIRIKELESKVAQHDRLLKKLLNNLKITDE